MIVCADSRFQNTDFFANECAKDAAILAGAVVGTQFIFLCPAFFTTPVFPLESQCPVVKSVTTLSAGVDAWSTQYTSMLHELVRIYLGTYLEPPVDKINEVMVLGPGDSVINMGSYAWYAICESRSLYLFPFLLRFVPRSDGLIGYVCRFPHSHESRLQPAPACPAPPGGS